MNELSQATEVAKSISDYGALVVMGAIYLVLTASMMVTVFRWFKSIIDRIMTQQEEFKLIMKAIHDNGVLMGRIAEGLRPETQLRIRNLSGFAFDLSVEQVCRLIKKIREENHIADRKATSEKIRMALRVIHEDRNSRFDTFTYGGTKLSAYTNADWIEQVAKVVEGEIYHEGGANNGRAYTNVKLMYDNIKTDFYHRLNS